MSWRGTVHLENILFYTDVNNNSGYSDIVNIDLIKWLDDGVFFCKRLPSYFFFLEVCLNLKSLHCIIMYIFHLCTMTWSSLPTNLNVYKKIVKKFVLLPLCHYKNIGTTYIWNNKCCNKCWFSNRRSEWFFHNCWNNTSVKMAANNGLQWFISWAQTCLQYS